MQTFKSILSFLGQLLLLVALPFLLLIRGAVWLYTAHEWPWALGLLAGMAGAFFFVLVYITMVYQALFGSQKKLSRRLIRFKALVAGVLVLGFSGYTLFQISGLHTKNEAVEKEYRELHPLLRVAVGTLVMFDESVLITDLSRLDTEYQQMGLPQPQHSLHYKQKTGYVHAMDLRTRDRGWLRNRLTQTYFWLMGFNTLRHVGTADHLHVSLSLPGGKGGV